MPPKASASSPTKSATAAANNNNRNKAAKSDPFGGMLSLTGSALTTQQLQQEAALAKSPKRNEKDELIGGDDTTKPAKNGTEEEQQQKEKVQNNIDQDQNEDEQEGEEGEEEEILCSNNVGTEADREFDELIGTIENFLVSDELEAARQGFFDKLPDPENSDLPQQEKYILFKKYVEFLDELLDSFVTTKFPGKNIEDFAKMILERQDEVSMDVLELVSGGEESGLDYESFVQMWELYSTRPSTATKAEEGETAAKKE